MNVDSSAIMCWSQESVNYSNDFKYQCLSCSIILLQIYLLSGFYCLIHYVWLKPLWFFKNNLIAFQKLLNLSAFDGIKGQTMNKCMCSKFSSVQSLSRIRFFVTPWTEAWQASLSITNSQNLLKLMSIESVMPSNHLVLCRPLLLPPLIFPSIRVFSS